MKFFEVFFITGLISILICQSGAQQCLHTEQGIDTGPPFEDNNNSPTLPARSQVITPTYRFRCCGEIEEWRTFVSRSNGRYNVTFQVWRPTASQIPNCYTFVGENKFTNINTNGNEIIVTIPSRDRIYFQENDVVGFDITRIGGNGGIQLLLNDNEYRNDVIWYNTFSANNPVSGYPKSCPYCIGAGRLLPTSTSAAPVFSAVLDTTSCRSSQPLLSTIPSSCQPSSSLVHVTTIEQTIVEIVMENTELVSPTSTLSPATTTDVATADISMTSTKSFNNVLQQTPSPTPSPTIRPAPIDLFLTISTNLEFSNKNRSSNVGVIAAAITVLIVMIITLIVVVIFVITMVGTKQKKRGFVNPVNGNCGSTNIFIQPNKAYSCVKQIGAEISSTDVDDDLPHTNYDLNSPDIMTNRNEAYSTAKEKRTETASSFNPNSNCVHTEANVAYESKTVENVHVYEECNESYVDVDQHT